MLLWWMIIRVKKKMLSVQARKEYAHTFAHFNHRRCANVQKYMSVDDQSSKKKLLNWCWRGARKRFLSVSKLIKWMWWVVKFESKKMSHIHLYLYLYLQAHYCECDELWNLKVKNVKCIYICEFSQCDKIFYFSFFFIFIYIPSSSLSECEEL